MKTEEFFDVVNHRDEVVGRERRSEVHRLGLKHRSVHVLIFNQRGELFLQKRSMKKDNFPGTWDSSASGHLAPGESYDDAALRETQEELGVRLAPPPTRLLNLAACPETGQEFVWVYRAAHEGPFKLHPDEIETGAWFAPERITAWLAAKPQEFSPSVPLIWQRWLALGASPAQPSDA